jgi:hypothetical protein
MEIPCYTKCMFGFIKHFFIPHHTNNQRAKLIHHDVLLLVAFIFLVATFLLSGVKKTHPNVLGTTIDMSSQQLLLLTNAERQKVGVGPLNYNEQLAIAAAKKADDMFKDNYWAHISPVSGKTPWIFIHNSGYEYTNAGENLARGFATAEDTMKAWMASPTHRENVLSANYQDVGFAIKQGTLTGEDHTILVVEMFGGKEGTTLQNQQAKNTSPITSVYAAGTNQNAKPVSSITTAPVIDRVAFAKGITQFLLILFIFIFILDLIIIDRKKISRLVGHNLDHILFLVGILLFVMLMSSGRIF